jgi:hypothetical protein
MAEYMQCVWLADSEKSTLKVNAISLGLHSYKGEKWISSGLLGEKTRG